MNIRPMIFESLDSRITQIAQLNSAREFLVLLRLAHEVRLRSMFNHFPSRFVPLLANGALAPLNFVMFVDVLANFESRFCLQAAVVADEHSSREADQVDIFTMTPQVIVLGERHAAKIANFTLFFTAAGFP